MEAGQRDFVIERLEKQLLQKNEEIERMKSTLRDSIIRELRDELRGDLEINNRLIRLEQKVQELGNTMNGIMDELLDQKSMIQCMKSTEKEVNVEPPQHSGIAETLFAHQGTPIREEKVEEPSKELGIDRPRRSMHFNIKDLDTGENVEDVSPAGDEQEDDYIIASDDKGYSRQNTDTEKSHQCEYIIAEEQGPITRKKESEFETVENRDNEDTVITTTHKKSSF